MGAHVAAGGRRVAQQQVGLQVPQHEADADGHDGQVDHPVDDPALLLDPGVVEVRLGQLGPVDVVGRHHHVVGVGVALGHVGRGGVGFGGVGLGEPVDVLFGVDAVRGVDALVGVEVGGLARHGSVGHQHDDRDQVEGHVGEDRRRQATGAVGQVGEEPAEQRETEEQQRFRWDAPKMTPDPTIAGQAPNLFSRERNSRPR